MADLREKLNAIADRVLDVMDHVSAPAYGLLDEIATDLRALAAQPAPAGEVAMPERFPMDTAPRDGTVIVLYWGEDGSSPGWWSAQVSPIQNDDGTWPNMPEGFPWSFVDTDNGRHFVNAAVDTEYGPTSWSPYGDARAAAAGAKVPEGWPREWRSALRIAFDTLESEAVMRVEGGHDADARTMRRAGNIISKMLSAAPQPAVSHELTAAQERRLRELAAAESASYVGAGAHGIPDEPQPEECKRCNGTGSIADYPNPELPGTQQVTCPECNGPQPAPATVPDMDESSRVPDDYRNCAAAYRAGWNDRGACRSAAQPKPAEGGAVPYSAQQAILDRVLSEAFRAGDEGRGFDMLAAKRTIGEAFAPAGSGEAVGLLCIGPPIGEHPFTGWMLTRAGEQLPVGEYRLYTRPEPAATPIGYGDVIDGRLMSYSHEPSERCRTRVYAGAAPAVDAEALVIEPTHCRCHPETCCCGDYTLRLGETQITTGTKQQLCEIAAALGRLSGAEGV